MVLSDILRMSWTCPQIWRCDNCQVPYELPLHITMYIVQTTVIDVWKKNSLSLRPTSISWFHDYVILKEAISFIGALEILFLVCSNHPIVGNLQRNLVLLIWKFHLVKCNATKKWKILSRISSLASPCTKDGISYWKDVNCRNVDRCIRRDFLREVYKYDVCCIQRKRA